MSDWLVKLDERPVAPAPAPLGVVIRKPIGPEHHLLSVWVAATFSNGWASEVQVALGNRPITVFMAVSDAAE